MTGRETNTPIDSLPKRLRAARAVAEMSLDELAQEVGVERHRLGRWERGVDPVPPLVEAGLIAAVAKATGFPQAFFDGRESN